MKQTKLLAILGWLLGAAVAAFAIGEGVPEDGGGVPKDDVPTATWKCRNDLEVHCAEGTCKAEGADAFTPMDVRIDDSGAMSVCAYSGCWEGTGEVLRSEGFLVWIGHDLEFSTSPGPQSQADILVALDLADGVATLKAGVFAHPLLCDPLKGSP